MAELERIKSNIQLMIDQEVPEADIDEYIASEGVTLEQLQGFSQPFEIDTATGAPKKGFDPRATADTIRPILEFGGITAGALAGAPSGPFGSVVGAGLLGGAGSNMADRLEEFLGVRQPMEIGENLLETGNAITESAGIEMMGQSIGLVVGLGTAGVIKLFRRIKAAAPKLSDKDAMLKAKEILEDLQSLEGPEGAQAAKRLEEVQGLLKRADIKTEPTFAQKTSSHQAAALEQSIAAKNPEVAAILKGKDAQIAQEAFDNVQKNFKGNLDDFLVALEKEHAVLAQHHKQISGEAQKAAAGLYGAKNSQQQSGMRIHEVLSAVKNLKKDAVKQLFDELPQNLKLESEPIRQGLEALRADFKKTGGGPATMPSSIIRQIQKAVKKKKDITFGQLRDWRSQITQEIRENTAGYNPNLKLVRRLEMLKKNIDNALEQTAGTKYKKQYEFARKQYADYVKKYRKGEVGEVLMPGNLSSGHKVAFSDVPERFFRKGKLDKADDLIEAVGKEDAKRLIRDYAAHDYLARAGTPTGINAIRAEKWLTGNGSILRRYDLYGEFSRITNKGHLADIAYKNLETFQKKAVENILERDVAKVIESVFGATGKGKSAKIAEDLLNMPGIKGNKVAQDGLRAGLKDFLMSKLELTGLNSVGKALRDFEPAMRKLYTPKQVQSLKDYHEILRVIDANKNVSFAKGSTTAEKLKADEGKISSVMANTAQLFAVQLHKGWKFASTKNLAIAIYSKFVKNISQNQIDVILQRAIIDPEFAETVMMMSKGKFQKAIIEKRIKVHLLKLGLYTGVKTFEQLQDFSQPFEIDTATGAPKKGFDPK